MVHKTMFYAVSADGFVIKLLLDLNVNCKQNFDSKNYIASPQSSPVGDTY